MKDVLLKDFQYTLPDQRIALYPLEQRDHSKLLFYNQGKISHKIFYDIPALIPDRSTIYFNNTKVIPARLHFNKETGAHIEIFLLNPVEPSILLSQAMESTGSCTWRCTVGNQKKWKIGNSLTKQIGSITLHAKLLDATPLVEFTWSSPQTFAQILMSSGETPLPPYIHRKLEEADKERYQTVYSLTEGAVAAPTAGLHFTEETLKNLRDKGTRLEYLTLHVSAGTFQPVKAETAMAHPMHDEQIVISQNTIQSLIMDSFTIAAGTTSLRTLESLYWYGVKLVLKGGDQSFEIEQKEPYQYSRELPSTGVALEKVLSFMKERNMDSITGKTSLMIIPGYNFKIVKGLITNFHQPGSTLILLVAAFLGKDWREVYQQALENDYRFLSYGDSSLLIPGV